MSTIKIALTGGPCAGKTMVLEEIKKYIKENTNYNLIIIPETATELSLNVIKPQNVKNGFNFQDTVLKRQMFKENEVKDVLKYNDCKDNIIICDRGIIDNKAYLNSQEEFDLLISNYNKKELEFLDDYDLVIYLESVAHHDDIDYGFNNEARYEDKNKAAILDNNTVTSWIGHNNLKIIRARKNKKDKIDNVISVIKDELCKIRSEKVDRYMIDDFSDLSIYNDNNSKLINELDYYLNIEKNNYNYIVTKREYKGCETYLFHVIRYNNDEKVIMEERSLSKDEFLNLICKYGVIKKVNKSILSFYYDKRKFNIIELNNNKLIEFVHDNNLKLPSNIIISDKIEDMDKFIDESLNVNTKKLNL